MTNMTLQEASDHITSTNPTFELTREKVLGVEYPVFRNTPSHIYDLLKEARSAHGDGQDEYLVYQNERWTYDAFCSQINRMARVLAKSFNINAGDRVDH